MPPKCVNCGRSDSMLWQPSERTRPGDRLCTVCRDLESAIEIT